VLVSSLFERIFCETNIVRNFGLPHWCCTCRLSAYRDIFLWV